MSDHIETLDLKDEPKVFRCIFGAVGGQGGGAISEILFNAVRIERLKYGGQKAKLGSYEKRSMTPGLAQRSGSTITSLSFIDTHLTEDKLPDNVILSEMPHRASCDVIVAQEINELMKYIEKAKLDAWVISNEVRSITPPEKDPSYIAQTSIENQIEAAKEYLKDGTYIGLDGDKITSENHLDVRSLNVIMMGMMCAAEVIPISKESYIEAIGLRFKGKLFDANVKAFEIGETYFKEGRYKERDEEFHWTDLSVNEIRERAIKTAIRYRRKRAATKLQVKLEPIFEGIIEKYPENVAKYILEGYAQMVDFQDIKHANWYLSLVEDVFSIDKSTDHRMTKEFAQNMAGRIMQWDGPFRVAEHAIHDLPPQKEKDQIVYLEKKLQPTLEEIVGMIPVFNFMYKHPLGFLYRWYDKRRFKGRSTNIKTTNIFGFGFFWFLSKFKGIRRPTVRFRREKLLIEQINVDILDLYKLSPNLAEELCWYIGKIRGYSFIRHNHIVNYNKVVDGVKRIYKEKDENAAVNFIKVAYNTVSNAGQGTDELDELLSDHLSGNYSIPLIVADR